MKVEFLKEEKESIRLGFNNEDVTFANALKDELWNIKGIDTATLNKKHPLVNKPELLVQGKEPRKLLKLAAQNIKKNVEEFEKEILKQI